MATSMTEKNQDDATKKSGKRNSINPLAVIGSVFAAGLGVQSSKNRERDFKQGNFKTFVVAGIVFTLLFIGVVYGIVQIVLKSAGA
jgi:hypothetical protein